MPAIHGADRVVRNAGTLVRAAGALAVPVLVSEQYPKGLGATVAELRDVLPDDSVIEKITFSCAGEPVFMERLAALRRDRVVLVGAEAHVCVMQTALGLTAAGYKVVLVADAVASRDPANADLAIARLRGHGVEIAGTEMLVFEWMERAGTPTFKSLLPLIK